MATILVCVDNSDLSARAFEWYLRKFHKDNHKVVVLHVPEYWGNMVREMSPARIDECIRQTNAETEELKLKYTDLCQRPEVNVDYSIDVQTGNNVWHVVCEYAKTKGASAIVLGCRGRGLIKRTVLGSVSEGILHHSDVPVLIYKEK